MPDGHRTVRSTNQRPASRSKADASHAGPAEAQETCGRKFVRLLRRHYPAATCSLDFHTPLELLVATILSAQCTDERVNIVTKDLFRKYRSAADYAQVPIAELEKDIQSTGFFRNKAKSIQNCCRLLVEQYDGQVPQDIEQLVELPGIGRKTANVILGTAFGIASGVVVDTHVTRLSRRLGLSQQKDAEKIEKDLMEVIPSKEWIAFSHRMIQHGRKVCVARKPKCDDCPLQCNLPQSGRRTSNVVPHPEVYAMVLSGHEIRQQLGKNIVIDPFEESRLNPNSYNLTLHDELLIYEEVVLDMRRPNRVRRHDDSRRGPGAAAAPALPGPNGRADRNPQLRADDRRAARRSAGWGCSST